MSTKTSRAKVAGVVLLAAITLAACEGSVTMKINSSDSMTTIMEFRDTDGMFAGQEASCSDLEQNMGYTPGTEVTVEDISSGGVFGCRVTMETNTDLTVNNGLEETDDTFILTLDPGDTGTTFTEEDIEMMNSMGGAFTFTIEMPGDIIRADGATIEGNRATFTDFTALTNGFTVEGYKTGSGNSGGSDSGTTGGSSSRTTQSSSEDGFPMWAWIAIGVGAVAVIGGIIFAVTRKKKTAPYPGPYGQPQGFAPQGQPPYGQPQGFAPQGQPPYGQPQGQPPQGQPPYGQPQGFAPHSQPGQAPTQPPQNQPPYGQP